MNKEIILALVRHGMTAIGPLIVSSGLADEGQLPEVTGAAVTIVGVLWSIMRKVNRASEQKAKDAALKASNEVKPLE